jgi:antitoxin HigA-1
MGISQYRPAKDINVPARRINEIVHGKRSVSADTALRLSKYFKMSALFWNILRAHYELETVIERLLPILEKEIKAYKAA